jgi:hypothetical protein
VDATFFTARLTVGLVAQAEASTKTQGARKMAKRLLIAAPLLVVGCLAGTTAYASRAPGPADHRVCSVVRGESI